MGQNRTKIGFDFEHLICEQNGWIRESASPKIVWSGKGRNNLDKVKSINFNPELFVPDFEKSKFSKYDAITSEGKKVEIKKYKLSKFDGFILYSEPVIKIATKSDEKRALEVFGNKDKYNSFIKDLYENFKKNNIDRDILIKMTMGTHGIQVMDGFIPRNDLVFRWEIIDGWNGWNRLAILCRKKPTT
jgi:hypothetical protein